MAFLSRVLLGLIVISTFSSQMASAQPSKGIELLRTLPLQEGGRLKPFDTFARETLQLVYGKTTYKERPAYQIVMTWLLVPHLWENEKILKMNHHGLKEALNLPEESKHFSAKELMQNQRLDLVFRELAEMRENNEKLTPYFQAVQRLESQMFIFHRLRIGGLSVAPPKKGDTWIAIQSLEGELQNKFVGLTRAFAQNLAGDGSPSELKTKDDDEDFKEAFFAFVQEARSQNPELYPEEPEILREVHYNEFHPFQWAWIFYLVCAFLALSSRFLSWGPLYKLTWAAALVGLVFHSYGFYLRVAITGRPPVSNMYETVVWVAWGAVVISMALEYVRKNRLILMAGALVGTLCMIVSDMAPILLDSTLQPLEPVLRSNMWLLIHVLTITLSYAPLFLGFFLGAIGISFILAGDHENTPRVKSMVQAVYRCIQIGLVLLIAGTILGGVWADYSWGRFWGWDPKETWAFIAIMGYLALLHGRLTGWVKNFGMLAGAVVAFNLIIMAWYGVNFVLGAGLHSYGFGAGGLEWVSAFCGLFLVYSFFGFLVHRGRQKEAKAP